MSVQHLQIKCPKCLGRNIEYMYMHYSVLDDGIEYFAFYCEEWSRCSVDSKDKTTKEEAWLELLKFYDTNAKH